MEKLTAILDQFAAPAAQHAPDLGRAMALGRAAPKTRLTEVEREALREQLERHGAANDRLVWVIVLMLVLLFLVSIGIVVLNLHRPAVAGAAGGALGISAAGCIRWLLQVWREKAATEQLLQLAISLEGDALAAIVGVLTRRAAIVADPVAIKRTGKS